MNNIFQNVAKCTVNNCAQILFARGKAGSLQSAKTIASRQLKAEVESGTLKAEKIGRRTVYMLPHLTGYTEHDELITDAIVQLMMRWDVSVVREKRIPDIALQPDAICYVTSNRHACILIVEAINTETQAYFQQKKTVWERWSGALEYLSNLFGVKVPFYHLVTHGNKMGVMTGVMTLEEAIHQMEKTHGTIQAGHTRRDTDRHLLQD